MVKIDQKGNTKKIFFFTFMLSSAPWEPEQSGSQKNREGSGAGAKNLKIWGAGAEAEPKNCGSRTTLVVRATNTLLIFSVIALVYVPKGPNRCGYFSVGNIICPSAFTSCSLI